MASRLDQIIVVDVEATCWEKNPPENMENEIIEIGICMLDVQSGQRVSKQSILVRPEFSKVSPFCTQLTTLTQEQVDKGVSFKEACKTLIDKYASKQRCWASYGNYDRNQFERQCEKRDIGYPFGASHINVKTLLAVMHGLKREVGMAEGLRVLNLPLEGVHHRGDDDAWNIALILSKLIKVL